jgi:hypothetical protein
VRVAVRHNVRKHVAQTKYWRYQLYSTSAGGSNGTAQLCPELGLVPLMHLDRHRPFR